MPCDQMLTLNKLASSAFRILSSVQPTGLIVYLEYALEGAHTILADFSVCCLNKVVVLSPILFVEY